MLDSVKFYGIVDEVSARKDIVHPAVNAAYNFDSWSLLAGFVHRESAHPPAHDEMKSTTRIRYKWFRRVVDMLNKCGDDCGIIFVAELRVSSVLLKVETAQSVAAFPVHCISARTNDRAKILFWRNRSPKYLKSRLFHVKQSPCKMFFFQYRNPFNMRHIVILSALLFTLLLGGIVARGQSIVTVYLPIVVGGGEPVILAQSPITSTVVPTESPTEIDCEGFGVFLRLIDRTCVRITRKHYALV